MMRFARSAAVVFTGALIAGTAVAAITPAAAVVEPVFSIAKENTGPASIVAGSGQTAEFTITVSYVPETLPGSQPAPVYGTGFIDSLPYGLVIDTLPPGCTASSWDPERTFTCTVEFTGGATSASVVVKAAAPDWVRPGTYTNCAYLNLGAAPSGAQSVPSGCSLAAPAELNPQYVAAASVDVTNDADLQLTANDPGQVDPGKTADLVWTVLNAGPSSATLPLTLKSTLPAGITFVSSEGSDPWQCTAVGQEVTCTYTVAPTYTAPPDAPQQVCGPALEQPSLCEPLLPPGAPVPALKWKVSTAKPGTVATYDVVATVTSATDDSAPANNSATATIKVTPVDLAVTKTAATPVRVGDELEWSVTASNVGTIDDAAKVTLSDTLPAGATFVSAQADGWTCAVSGRTITCTRPDFPIGDSAIRVRTTMTERGAATNTVKISTGSYEQNIANNTSEKSVRVNRVEQTAKPLPASPARVKSGRTDQGQKLRTTVRCRPLKSNAAGEVAFCKVKRSNGVVRVAVKGQRPVKVTIVQTAKGTAAYKPFFQRKTYIVRP